MEAGIVVDASRPVPEHVHALFERCLALPAGIPACVPGDKDRIMQGSDPFPTV
jgi:hypothetical protein